MEISIKKEVVENGGLFGTLKLVLKRTTYILKFDFMNGNIAYKNGRKVLFTVAKQGLPVSIFQAGVKIAVEKGWYRDMSDSDSKSRAFRRGLRVGEICTYLSTAESYFSLTGKIVTNDGDKATMDVNEIVGNPSNEQESLWFDSFHNGEVITIERSEDRDVGYIPF